MRAGGEDSRANDGPGTATAREASRRVRLAVFLAVGASLLCTVALGTRTLTSLDLGYHLAYGEQALTTGGLVDHNPYLYTLPAQDVAPTDRPAPGPGSWYDAAGRYRFPNANWLSQLAMAAVFGWAGIVGLCALGSLLVALVGCLVLRGSRRLGLPWTESALTLLWIGLVAYSRFNLRPELFGYLAFAALLALLGPLVLEPRRAADLRWPHVVAIASLQLGFANLHSYWPLGLAIAGSVAFECLVQSLAIRSDATTRQTARAWQRARTRSALLVFAMLAVCFANPWTWRLVALPLETLAYLREHQIGGTPGAHPWSHILEFRRTLQPGSPLRLSDLAILGMVALSGLGAFAALLRRRWALVLVLIGMLAVALSMRRNVAAAALATIPLGLAALEPYRVRIVERLRLSERVRPTQRGGRLARDRAIIACASGVTVIAAVFTYSIVTHRFYLAEGHPMRFGSGLSRAYLPIGAAEWLDEHRPGARVWCDMVSSSTLHYFTLPHREVPILSNTWAYPPAILTENRTFRTLRRPVERLVTDYAADVVVLDHEGSTRLYRALAKHSSWELVHLEGRNALFVRQSARDSDDPAARVRDAPLASISDTAAYVTRQRAIDPAVETALLRPGVALLHAGLGALAVETFEAVLRERPDRPEAWHYLGLAFLVRAARGGSTLADLDAAQNAFERALDLDPGNEVALENLERLERRRERSPSLEDEQGRRDPS